MATSKSIMADLGDLPPIFILPSHLQPEELHAAEDSLYQIGGKLSYQASEARIFLGRISHQKRAAYDLRAAGVWSEEVFHLPQRGTARPKRQKGDDISSPLILSDSDAEGDRRAEDIPRAALPGTKRKHPVEADLTTIDLSAHVVVLKLKWLEDCLQSNEVLSYQSYLVYAGKIIARPASEPFSRPTRNAITYIKVDPDSSAARSKSPSTAARTARSASRRSDSSHHGMPSSSGPFHRRKFGQRSSILNHKTNPPKLRRTTTSEYEESTHSDLPPLPAWLLAPHPRSLYSCHRDTPQKNKNQHFITQLTKIRNARLLTLDEIGVRAYSTSIAALSAYPYRIMSPMEITRLPGCDQKIATLWVEWRNSVMTPTQGSDNGEDLNKTHESAESVEVIDKTSKDDENVILDAIRTIPIVNDFENDKDLQILNLFHEIWGVGPETARKFYYQLGFRDLDDLVELYWPSLTRVQQIGVKYYDEFKVKIPRTEVEQIAKTILRNARRARGIPKRYWSKRIIGTRKSRNTGSNSDSDSRKAERGDDGDDRDEKIQTEPVWPWEDPHGIHTHPQDFVAVIVGGHRRGKLESGDVDVILSHRDEKMTKDLIVDVVRALEEEGWITHTLTLHTTTSDRGGGTLPFRAQGHAGHGFDSLDKALCVWQDPNFDQHDDGGNEDDDDDGDDDESNDIGNSDSQQEKPKGEENKNPPRKNPNIHRRVDIIISSWKTLGCAVMGWSGGTTFQRDVRRWVKREKGWKFDSSGVRDRRNGNVLDLEELPEGSALGLEQPGNDQRKGKGAETEMTDGWEDREKRLMNALGIGWRDPTLRCTG